ncbi:hypothetical protein I7I51_02947 [Histoplasma capsulatum]|uniref:Uncharacterized protein n=1 Tax=Ajellomyces capsulatus TaxID=5037 RepID=A0A8A1MJH2_AJECA|nr:hypothetical protein I7I51_02947 [Histoplasma capsulatum]
MDGTYSVITTSHHHHHTAYNFEEGSGNNFRQGLDAVIGLRKRREAGGDEINKERTTAGWANKGGGEGVGQTKEWGCPVGCPTQLSASKPSKLN